jgi:hypothetical protein
MKALLAALAALPLGACAYNATVTAAPNLAVYSSYGDKLPGRYLLHVDGSAFSSVVRPTGLNCSAHNFPLEFRDAFERSVVGTFQQLVEDVQVVERPVPQPEIAASGAAGMIVVRGEGVSARLIFIPGFWTSTPEATVEMTASLTVDTPTGRVLGTTTAGDATSQIGAGGDCGSGAISLGAATQGAMKELMGGLGERMANSPRLRDAVKAAPAAQ